MNNPRTRERSVTVESPCRALMVLMVRQFTSSYIDSVEAEGCMSQPSADLLPGTVLVSLEAGINCTVCCVVVSHPGCICFCTVCRPVGTTGRCLQRYLLSKHFFMIRPTCLVCRVGFFLCVVKWKQTELLTGTASLVHLVSVVSYCLISSTNSIYFLYCGHLLLFLSMIGSASYWADCLSQYIKTYIYIYLMSNLVCLYFTFVK